MRFFGKSDHSDLERELRALRPEPREDFVRALAKRTARRQPVRLGWRIGLAGALTGVLLAAVAAVGGSATVQPVVHLGSLMKSAVGNGNANANGNSQPAGNAARPSSGDSSSSNSQSSATDQYKFLVCHHPPGNPGNFQTLSVGSQAAVNAHVANHQGDHPGACGPNG